MCRFRREGTGASCSRPHGTPSPCASGPLPLPARETSGIVPGAGSSTPLPGELPRSWPGSQWPSALGRMTGLSTCGSRSARS